MSLEFSEELLSAYLDGEVSPGEREQVQQLLQNQPEIQAQLDQLIVVRDQLRALPRQKAPDDFVSSILDRVELSQIENSSKLSPASQETANSSFRLSQLGRRPLAAVVAVLLIGITLVYQLNTSDEQTENSAFIADTAAHSSSIEFAEQVLEEAMLVTSAQQEPFAAGAVAPMEIPELPKLANRTADSLHLADSKRAESFALSLSSSELQAPKVVALKRETIQQHLESLAESPEVGDELSILTSRDESPILVDFTVVDVQKSLGTLQVLLKNHSVEEIELDDQVKQLTPSNSSTTFDANQKMVAVYLHLAEPELESVLNQVVALDATLIVPEDDSLSVDVKPGEALSFQQNGGSQPLAGGADGLAIESEPASAVIPNSIDATEMELAVIPNDASSVERIQKSEERTPQNYNFDFGLIRSYSDLAGKDLMPQMQSVAATSADDMISTGGTNQPMARPPAPQLPVRFDDTLVETDPAAITNEDEVRNGITGMSATDSISTEEAPGSISKRVKALLILRQEKPELDRSE